MRYIGGKSLLLENIDGVIEQEIGWNNVTSAIDIFSGSGVVSRFFKQKGINVHSNDNLYYAYALSRGMTGINHIPDFSNISEDVIETLNDVNINESEIEISDCFVYNNYSPTDTNERMYFQNDNALKIDIIRQTIEGWYKSNLIDADGYYYLLAALLNAVPYIANITGTFGAYLKFWDQRTYNTLTLENPEIIHNGNCLCHNSDYSELLPIQADLLYADPPYNGREYLPNYHVLETIAKYDNPELHGITGMRDYTEQKSVFCKKTSVYKAFETMICDAQSRYILISYNNEGLITTEDLTEICTRYAMNDSFRLYEYPYRRYKNKIPNNNEGLKEQLYFLRRH